MEAAVMIEGQNGLTWNRWKRIGKAVEDLGFSGLFRSDHFTNASPPDKDSLELWISLTWLADNTEKIEFGPLVSPVSFRNPAFTARIASQVDELSGGRLKLGLGAGWQEREHELFGFDLLDLQNRFNRFDEGIEIIHNLLTSSEPYSFTGDFFSINEAQLHPRPKGPSILVGGNGLKRTLPNAAKYAVEWNGLFLNPNGYKERIDALDSYIAQAGRKNSDVVRSLMTGTIYGKDQADLNTKLNQRMAGKTTQEALLERGLLIGTANQIVEQLGKLQEAGLEKIMLQWLDLDDLDGLEHMAVNLLPQIQAL